VVAKARGGRSFTEAILNAHSSHRYVVQRPSGLLVPASAQHGFRREKAVVFVDESGSFRSAHGETATMAAVTLPDTPEQLAKLRDLVQQLRVRFPECVDPKGRVKGKLLPEPAFVLIADDIRERWVWNHCEIPLAASTSTDFAKTFGVMRASLPKGNLGLLEQFDLHVASLERELESASEKFSVHLGLYFAVLRLTAQWFQQNSILPSVRVYFDEKLPRTAQHLADFLVRFTFGVTFDEVYRDRLGELLGTSPCHELRGEVSTDDEQDGIVIADAVAYAAGRVARGDDATGFYGRLLSRMNSAQPTGGAP
jgi:hypothetical protein